MTTPSSLEQTAADPSHTARSAFPDEQERQNPPRIEVPFLATVRGFDREGARFEADTVLDSLSTHGLTMRLARPVDPGARMLIVVRFSIDPARGGSVPGVVARGVVRQVESQPDGTYDVEVAFIRHRFLYASAADH